MTTSIRIILYWSFVTWSYGRFTYSNLVTTYTSSNVEYSEPRLFISNIIWNGDGRCVQRTGTYSQWLNEPIVTENSAFMDLLQDPIILIYHLLSLTIDIVLRLLPKPLRALRTCYSLLLPVPHGTYLEDLTG